MFGVGGRAGDEIGDGCRVAAEHSHRPDIVGGGEVPPDDGAIESAGVEGGGIGKDSDGSDPVWRRRGGPQARDGGAPHLPPRGFPLPLGQRTRERHGEKERQKMIYKRRPFSGRFVRGDR